MSQLFKKERNILKNGGIIAFPTETVYGLGCLVSQEKAIKRLREIKQRTETKSFTIHIAKMEDVKMVAIDIPKIFYVLAKKFWPGPLTIVIKKHPSISSLISANNTIGIRMPSHPTFLGMAKTLPEPIVGTSANLRGEDPINTAMEIREKFGNKVDMIINGNCMLNQSSTVISLLDGKIKILRKGPILLAY